MIATKQLPTLRIGRSRKIPYGAVLRYARGNHTQLKPTSNTAIDKSAAKKNLFKVSVNDGISEAPPPSSNTGGKKL